MQNHPAPDVVPATDVPAQDIPATDIPAKAVHSWSLFRTLGRFVAPGSMPSGDLPTRDDGGLALLDLPAELAARGYQRVQLCHFYLPRTDPDYLTQLRTAFERAGIELECFLVDDGDLSHPDRGDHEVDWVSSWISVGEQLGAGSVRVPAGKQPPTPDTLAASAAHLLTLAERHPGTRILVENWHALLPDAAAVNDLLDRTEGRIGFLIDLGNWTGPGKYDELAQVVTRAESCQAKVSTDAHGAVDEDDYRASLQVLVSAGYSGAVAMVHDGPDDDEWGKLDQARTIIEQVWRGR